MQEVENILKILEEAKVAVKDGQVVKLKQLSDRTNNTAALTQDPNNIAVAVIVYSLSKIVERKQYSEYKGWKKFYDNLILYIDKLISSIKKNDKKLISDDIKKIRGLVNGVSGNLKKDIQDVFRKASINKASKIYEHGISMETTASLLGITMFELASYAGQKSDTLETSLGKTVDVKSRIKLAMEIFG